MDKMAIVLDRRVKKSKAVIARFLSTLSQGKSVAAASDSAGITRITAYEWRREDEEFAAQWDSAIEFGTDALEDVALGRAVDGVEQDVYYEGGVVGTKILYSDGLLQFLLKGRRREKWGDKPDAGENAPVININISTNQLDENKMKLIEQF